MAASCSICIDVLCNLQDDQNIVVIKCGHSFHSKCLMEWKLSSKQMTCPECRERYSVRTVKKLYLNILPKDPNDNPELFGQLQDQKLQADNLKRDKERLALEKQQREFELLKSRDEVRNLVYKNQNLEREFAIKCQAYTLISVVNDDYLVCNDTLRNENNQLKTQLASINHELDKVKAQQWRASKPFVDLTHDGISDDSDVEIVEVKRQKLDASATVTAPQEVIELDDEVPTENENAKPEGEPQSNEESFKDEKGAASHDSGSGSNMMSDLSAFILEHI